MKRAFTLIELLIILAIIGIIVAVAIPALSLGGCKPPPQSTRPVSQGWVSGMGFIHEFTYEGCQYLSIYKGGISHKGNCTNSIHHLKAEQ